MEKVDIIIIGAGVIGLAIAEKLSSCGKEIVVVEKHDGFGREASSRNSEVIHAGMYYPEDSLKARMCVAGNRMLYALCEEKCIPYQKLGKIIVAGNEEEEKQVNNLYEQGMKNGIQGLQLLHKSGLHKKEPNIAGEMGLFSPETGILDTHQLMKYFEQTAESNGVIIAYDCEVIAIAKKSIGFILDIRDADNEMMHLQSEIVINAAGLSSDVIAESAGIDIDAAGYRIHPCKGEYFSVLNRHKGKLRHLIYPAPTTISLGIHEIADLNGSLKLGPNAFYVDSIDYDVNLNHQEEFYQSARRFLPFIEFDDLAPDMAGIRSKLQKEGESFRDFVITEESERGLPGLINLIGIESPGLTACLAIADEVSGLLS